MDFFDDVLNLEELAFEEGKVQGREEALAKVKEDNHKLGVENGREVAREIARIKTLGLLVKDHPGLDSVASSIEAIHIDSSMSIEEIRRRYLELANQFKLMLAKLKIKPSRCETLSF